MSKEWNELNKRFQVLISKKETFLEGKLKLLELRKSMYDMVMTVKKGFNHQGYSLMPFEKSKGYDCKTMAYSIYHITRIEDIVCHTILKGDEQVFDQKDYQKLLNIDIKTTGNELSQEEIITFSQKINIDELFNYFNDVYFQSNSYIDCLEYNNLKENVSLEKKKHLYETDYVSKNESSIWLIDYWCSKNTLGLLKMPFSRHWIMHIDAFLKIKNEIVKRARKEMKNKISICGLSCNHCFLGQWCGGCRTDYNCCSYKTLFDDGVCPNVSCALSKKIEGCYNCTLLDSCEIGFYKKTNDGSSSAKACAMFIRKYDKKCFIKTLDKMHQEYEFIKMQELLGRDAIEGLKMLEKYMIEDEEI